MNKDFLLEKIYSNQEIHNSKLEAILVQTTKHNGRLSKTEEKLKDINQEIERLKEKTREYENDSLRVKTGYNVMAWATGGFISLWGVFEVLLKFFR